MTEEKSAVPTAPTTGSTPPPDLLSSTTETEDNRREGDRKDRKDSRNLSSRLEDLNDQFKNAW